MVKRLGKDYHEILYRDIILLNWAYEDPSSYWKLVSNCSTELEISYLKNGTMVKESQQFYGRNNRRIWKYSNVLTVIFMKLKSIHNMKILCYKNLFLYIWNILVYLINTFLKLHGFKLKYSSINKYITQLVEIYIV